MIRSAVLTQITGVTSNSDGPDSDGPGFDGSPSLDNPTQYSRLATSP